MPKFRYAFILFPLLILIFIAFLTSCQSREAASQTLKLGLLPIEDNFPFYVAEYEGMYSKAGLNVDLVSFNGARERDTAIQAGTIDGTTADIIATGLLKKAGTPVKIVSLTMGATPGEGRFALLAAPRSKIESPEELQGTAIAISQNTIIEYVADQLLNLAGLESRGIEKIAVPSMPDRLQLLLEEKVQAAVLPDPLATLAEKQGARVILDDTKFNKNISQVVLVFREDTINSRREDISKLLQVYERAAQMVSGNPKKYHSLFVEKVRIPASLRDIYFSPKYSSPQLPAPEDVQSVMVWMVEKGLIEKPYSYQELVDSRFLKNES